MHQLSFAFNPRVVRLCGFYKLHKRHTQTYKHTQNSRRHTLTQKKEEFNINNNDKHTPIRPHLISVVKVCRQKSMGKPQSEIRKEKTKIRAMFCLIMNGTR